MRRRRFVAGLGLLMLAAAGPARSQPAALPAAVGPVGSVGSVIVVETSRGTFSFETFPADAPLTVAHVLALVRAGFYDGQRIHRALPGFVVQFGDPQSKDLAKRELWGRGAVAASGHPIGAAEITPKRPNRKGAVGMAHLGDPAKADSQIYVTLADRPDLDGHYAVFGQIVSGDDVLPQIQVGDAIVRAYVKQ